MVFTLPAPISAIAYYNKAVIYDLLFDVAAETLRTIAADPRHLGAQIGVTLVLHTWGSALTHHPHVHGIVPGGGPLRRRALGRLQAGFLPAGAGTRGGSGGASSRNLPGRIAAGSCSSSASTPPSLTRPRLPSGLARCARVNGWFMPSAPLPDPKRCSPTSPATPTGWRSPTQRLIPPLTSAASPSAARIIEPKGRVRYKTMTLAGRGFMRRFLLHAARRLSPHPPLWTIRQCRAPGKSRQGT